MSVEITESNIQLMNEQSATAERSLYILALNDYISSIMCSRFTWDIPRDVIANQFTIETSLLNSGLVAFIETDTGYYILPVIATKYNIINDPTEITIIKQGDSNTVINKLVDDSKIISFIPCYNTLQRKSEMLYLNTIKNEIAEIMYIMIEIIRKMVQPYVVTTTDKKIFSDKMLMNDILTKKYVFTDNCDNIKILDLNINPEYLVQLQTQFDDRMRRLHGLLGLSYDIDPKKERLINAEQEARNEVKEIFTQSMLNARLQFCHQVYDKYGVALHVESTI